MGRGLIRLRRTHRKSRSTQNGTQAGPEPFSTSTRCNSKKGSGHACETRQVEQTPLWAASDPRVRVPSHERC